MRHKKYKGQSFRVFSSILISLLLIISIFSITQAEGGAIEVVTVKSDGSLPNRDIYKGVALSADGNYVAFHSSATDLVDNDTNGREDMFMHNRLTGETWRVSVASDGTQGDGTNIHDASVSGDGRYVVFSTTATNLVAGYDTQYQCVLHDNQTGETTMASLDTSGNNEDFSADSPVISDNGRYIAYMAYSYDNKHQCGGRYGGVVYDLTSGTRTCFSPSLDGDGGNAGIQSIDISADGRYVAYSAWSSNLVNNDTNGEMDVFVRDRTAGTTTRVSVDENGDQIDVEATNPKISNDGRFVVFLTAAALVSEDTNNTDDVYLYDLVNEEPTLVSKKYDGSGITDALSCNALDISGNGRYIAYGSQATNIVHGDDEDTISDHFVYDRINDKTIRISVKPDGYGKHGSSMTNDCLKASTLSTDGSVAAFLSNYRLLSTVSSSGDFGYIGQLDFNAPEVSSHVPADGALLGSSPSELSITFNERVMIDSSVSAANYTGNYMLVEAGANETFDTTSCAGGLAGDDSAATISSATYTRDTETVTLGIGSLDDGLYRVFTCGTTSITDPVGNRLNDGESDETFDFTVDSSPPEVEISSSESSPTNSSPIPISIEFSKSVTGFTSSDLSVTNGSVSSFSGSGATYTASITPASDGTVSVDIAADVAEDTAGNLNEAAETFTIIYDNTAPTVSIASTASSPTNSSPIPITITFSESVTGFTSSDLTVTNGSAGSFSGSGTTYTASITPSSDGTVSVKVNSDKASDAAGNDNEASSTFSITYDSTAPTVSIASSASSPTNGSPIPITITFSESVTGFTASDLTVTNGSAGSFSGSGTTYTTSITPAADGTVSVKINSDKATDAAGNGNTASSTFSITFDSTAPTVSIASSASSPTNGSPIPITITFSESVTGFTSSDLTVTNGSAGSFSGSGTTYTASITPSSDGTVSVKVNSGKASDAAGNSNAASSTFSITYDSTAPTVSIDSSASSPTNGSPIPITITFNESVSGFTVSDLTVTNGSAGSFSGSGTTYTASVTPAADGVVSIRITSGKAADAAGNGNAASSTFSISYDSTAPTVSIASSASSPTNGLPIPITITFSENVSGFTASDLTVTNGSAGSLSGSGTTYTANITPAADGTVSVRITSGKAADAAGNGNTASSTFSISYDGTAPTVGIASSLSSPTGISPIPISITFSESVSGFTVSDLTITNGSAGDFSGSGTTYSANITPAADGVVSVRITSGKAADAAGNGNAASSTFSITYDATPPEASFTRQNPATNPTNADSLTFRVTFTEDVQYVDSSDFAVNSTSTATVTNVSSVDAATYDVTVSGGNLANFDGTVGLNFADAQDIYDLNGNAYDGDEPETDQVYTVDNTAMTGADAKFTRHTPTSQHTNADSLVFQVTFADGVLNVDSSDFSVDSASTATVSAVNAVSTEVYTVTVSGGNLADFNGTVGLDFASGQNITDLSGNLYEGDEPEVEESYTVDNTALTSAGISFTRHNPSDEHTNADTLVFRVTFNEDVMGLDVLDFTPDSDSTAAVTSVSSVDAATYDVTISGGDLASFNGTLGLDFSNSQNFTDLGGNAYSGDEPDTDEGYIVDNIALTSADISFERYNPSDEHTNADTLVFRVTFSEDIIGLDAADFELDSSTTAGITAVDSVDAATYDLTITGGDLDDFNGTLGLNFAVDQNFTDLGGNAYSGDEPDTDEVYTVDNTALTTEGIGFSRYNPLSATTNMDVLIFRVTFNEAVQDVDAADFEVDSTSTATITSVDPVLSSTSVPDTEKDKISPQVTNPDLVDVYEITVSGGDLAGFNGTLGLNFADDNDITDLGGNPIPEGEPDTDETYLIDNQDIAVFKLSIKSTMSRSVNKINVRFNKDVLDLPGNNEEDDVTNPDNYLLLQVGPDGIYNTQSCLEGLTGDDVQIPVNAVTYDNETFTASLIVNNAVCLCNGNYRMFICGTTSIVDSAGNILNEGHEDYISDFKIAVPPGWPLAGFSQDHFTDLPAQPDELTYTPGNMTLSIPSIGIELPIMGVPLTTNGWDITWLGSSAGYLEGTAYPTWEGNTVITAHIWDALNQPGPFLQIKSLQYGDLFYIHAEGKTYTYEVRKTFQIKASDIDSLLEHEDYDWVTLLTCESYDPDDDSYHSRRAVSAVLISVE